MTRFHEFTLLQKFSLMSLLCIVGMTGAVCAAGAAFFTRQFVRHDATVMADLARTLVTRSIPSTYFTEASPVPASTHEHTLAEIMPSVDVVRTIVYDAHGRVLWSDDPELLNRRFTENRELDAALRGSVEAHIIRPGKEEHEGTLRSFDRLEEIYLPIRYQRKGPIVGALEIYRHPPALFAVLDRALALVWVVGGGGGLVLYVALFGVVRRAARRQLNLEQELVTHARTLESRVAERTDELRATKDYLAHLIDSSVDAIVAVDARAAVTLVNRAGQDLFGVREEDIRGRSVVGHWARGPADFRRFRRLLLEKGRLQHHETELLGPHRQPLLVNISASLLWDAAGRVSGALAVVRDVTHVRRMQEQMIHTERLAAAGLLAAGVAHEVGNPLTGISSLTQLLLARASDPAVRSDLEDIEVNVERIERLLEDLTRLTEPGIVELSPTSVNEAVQEAVTLARHNPAVRKTAIHTVLDPAPLTVSAMPDKLLQVFLNLTLNAVDAGGQLTIRTTADRHTVRVVFEDTGRGMAPEQLKRAFDPFFSTKATGKHLGLGLFVSHEIVRQHGGSIVAESRPGAGSTFTVVLPREA